MNSNDNLLKHGTIMFVATSATNFLNYIFHIYMGRALGPSGYGILASLLSLLMIISITASSLQTLVTKYVASFKAKEQFGRIRYFLLMLTRKIFWYSILASAIFILLSGYISSFLNIPSRIPVVVLGTVVLMTLISPVVYGGLQGLQNFKQLGLNMIAGAVMKLIFGILLVAIGLGVGGALAAITLSIVVAIILAFVPLRFLLYREIDNKGLNSSEMKQYFWPVVIVLLCFSILTNIDVIIVKHFFAPIQAGHYAAAAIFGKIVLFFPGAIAMVMFPKAAELHTLEQDPWPVLKKSLLAVAVLCGLVTMSYFFFPVLIVSLLFGSRYYQSIPLMGLFGIAMTIFSLINIIIAYYLSIHNFKFVIFLIACTVLQVVFIWFFHSTLQTVISVVIGSGLFLLVLNWVLMYQNSKAALINNFSQ